MAEMADFRASLMEGLKPLVAGGNSTRQAPEPVPSDGAVRFSSVPSPVLERSDSPTQATSEGPPLLQFDSNGNSSAHTYPRSNHGVNMPFVGLDSMNMCVDTSVGVRNEMLGVKKGKMHVGDVNGSGSMGFVQENVNFYVDPNVGVTKGELGVSKEKGWLRGFESSSCVDFVQGSVAGGHYGSVQPLFGQTVAVGYPNPLFVPKPQSTGFGSVGRTATGIRDKGGGLAHKRNCAKKVAATSLQHNEFTTQTTKAVGYPTKSASARGRSEAVTLNSANRRLPASEFEARRAENQCYLCEASYTKGHNCRKKGQLMMMEIAPDEEALAEGDAQHEALPLLEGASLVDLEEIIEDKLTESTRARSVGFSSLCLSPDSVVGGNNPTTCPSGLINAGSNVEKSIVMVPRVDYVDVDHDVSMPWNIDCGQNVGGMDFGKMSKSDGFCGSRVAARTSIRDKGGGLTTHCEFPNATHISVESLLQLPAKNFVADMTDKLSVGVNSMNACVGNREPVIENTAGFVVEVKLNGRPQDGREFNESASITSCANTIVHPPRALIHSSNGKETVRNAPLFGSIVSAHLPTVRCSSTSIPNVGILLQDGDGAHKLEGVSVKRDSLGLSSIKDIREYSTVESGKGILENDNKYVQNLSAPKLSISYSGLADTSNHRYLGLSLVTQGPPVVQQPAPTATSPIGTFHMMEQMSICGGGAAPFSQYGSPSILFMPPNGVTGGKSQLSTVQLVAGSLSKRLEKYIEGLRKISHYTPQPCFSGFDKRVRDKGSGQPALTYGNLVLKKELTGNMRLLWCVGNIMCTLEAPNTMKLGLNKEVVLKACDSVKKVMCATESETFLDSEGKIGHQCRLCRRVSGLGHYQGALKRVCKCSGLKMEDAAVITTHLPPDLDPHNPRWYPAAILEREVFKKNNEPVTKWLIEWLGAADEEATWEGQKTSSAGFLILKLDICLRTSLFWQGWIVMIPIQYIA